MSRYEPYYKSLSKLGEIPWKKLRIRKLLKLRKKKWGFILSKVKRLKNKKRRVLRASRHRLRLFRKLISKKRGKYGNRLGKLKEVKTSKKEKLTDKIIRLKRIKKKRKSCSEKLWLVGGVSRKFRSYSKVWSGRFNYKLFLRNQQYFRKWYGKGKIKLYEIRKMSRMLLKKSSNSKLSLDYYFTKYLSMDPAIFFVRQGFVKSLSEGRLLVSLKKLKLCKSYPKIKTLDSLGFSVFKVDSLIGLFLLGSYCRKREERFKGVSIKKLTQRLILRWFYSNVSYLFKTKGSFSWPEISYLFGVLGRTARPRVYFSRSKWLLGKKRKISVFNLGVLTQVKALSYLESVSSFGVLKRLVSFDDLYLDFLSLKNLKKECVVSKPCVLESKGTSLSNWEERKGLVLKELNPKSIDFVKVVGGSSLIEGSCNYLSKSNFISLKKKGKALKKVLGKKEGLKKKSLYVFVFYNLLKLKNKKVNNKGNFKRLYLYFKRGGKGVNLLPELRICLKSVRTGSLRKGRLRSKPKRVKKVKKYNLQNKISSNYEVNYKTLSIFNVGKFSQMGTKNLECLPENLGALCTRLSY